MRGLRTIPVLLDVCRDLEELCPDALLLNYVNPMAMLCWAVAEASLDPHRRALPLRPAHGGRAGRRTSGCRRRDRLPRRRHQPPGVLPALRARRRGPLPRAARGHAAGLTTACATSCSSTSATSSPSPPSTSPSTSPWFIKDGREDLIERFNVPLDEYPRRCERQIARVGGAARRARGRRADRHRAQRTSTAPTSSAPARPASRSRSTATSRTAGRTGC